MSQRKIEIPDKSCDRQSCYFLHDPWFCALYQREILCLDDNEIIKPFWCKAVSVTIEEKEDAKDN
jgi:hypothetical protein